VIIVRSAQYRRTKKQASMLAFFELKPIKRWLI